MIASELVEYLRYSTCVSMEIWKVLQDDDYGKSITLPMLIESLNRHDAVDVNILPIFAVLKNLQ